MSTPPTVRVSVEADGVGWLIFDDPAARANVFNPRTQADLDAALTALAAAPIRAVVIRSAKEKIFLAGADLRWLSREVADPAAAAQAARTGQALFARLDDFPVPVVCAIHGACAGGGCELALACHWRLASDARETRLGLPEVGLGLIPGWGGCARLPRLIGARAAVEHILRAALLPAAAAQAAGLVDEVVPAADLLARAHAAALRLAAEGRPVRPAPAAVPSEFFSEQRQSAARRFHSQPAPPAVLDVIEQGAGLSLAAALDLEARHFGAVAAGAVAKSLLHVHFLKEAVRKQTVDAWFPPAPAAPPPAPLRRIGVVGAGVMGSGIAHWCALHGCGVLLSDSHAEALQQGVRVIRSLVDESVKRGLCPEADKLRLLGAIGTTTDLHDFADCDLVIEAIVENVAAKQALFAALAQVVRPDCLLASNTSALPIETLVAGVPAPGRTLGLHFFNPVGRMPLVELVLSPDTTRETAARALAFVQALGKSPVICRSAPGFYVTRVLFFYLNEACRLWEQGVPAATIDAAMRAWGWPMGPMRLIDEVGVDVTDFIYGEMRQYYGERFAGATVCGRMLAAGLRGRKNGTSAGFYTYGGMKEAPNPALAPLAPAGPVPALTAADIQERLNGLLLAESRRVLVEGVLRSPDDADFALLMGAGFPAYRGGLLWATRGAEPPPS